MKVIWIILLGVWVSILLNRDIENSFWIEKIFSSTIGAIITLGFSFKHKYKQIN